MTKDEIETLKKSIDVIYNSPLNNVEEINLINRLRGMIIKYSEDDQEYNLGDIVRVSDDPDRVWSMLADKFYLHKIGDYHLVAHAKSTLNNLSERREIQSCHVSLYKHIIPKPKDEYLDLMERKLRYFVKKDGSIFEISGFINDEVLKEYHKNGIRLLERIDPETGKAITKSLKIGEE